MAVCMAVNYRDQSGQFVRACRWIGCNVREIEDFLGESGYCKDKYVFLRDTRSVGIGDYIIKSTESTLDIMCLSLFLTKYTLADIDESLPDTKETNH